MVLPGGKPLTCSRTSSLPKHPKRRLRKLRDQLLVPLPSTGAAPSPILGKVKVGVIEAPPDLYPGEAAWENLAKDVASQSLDFLLLNELFAGSWISIIHPDEITRKQMSILDMEKQKSRSREVHSDAIDRLGEFKVPHIAGSRSQWEGGKTINEAFVWEAGTPAKIQGIHSKQFLPDDTEYFEAHWYDRGEPKFQVAAAGPKLKVAAMICTECFFNETVRKYRKHGANVIVVPRATPNVSRVTEQFQIACKMAAIMSGCYVLSSNRAYGPDANGVNYGGQGWIIHPSGEVIAETTPENPLVTAEIDLDVCWKFQHRYPNYVAELSEKPRMRMVPMPPERAQSGRGYVVVPEEG